jgi:hypothetical protein
MNPSGNAKSMMSWAIAWYVEFCDVLGWQHAAADVVFMLGFPWFGLRVLGVEGSGSGFTGSGSRVLPARRVSRENRFTKTDSGI